MDARFAQTPPSTVIDLVLTLGAALFGATALAFTLVMFAMQVNVERLPHGLFRKFASDVQLLAYFVLMFCVALLLTVSPLLIREPTPGGALLLTFWACACMALLLWNAYARALLLVSPTTQLQLMVAHTRRQLLRTVRHARHVAPFLPRNDAGQQMQQAFHGIGTGDRARSAVLTANPSWAQASHRAVSYAVSLAGRYAASGDYDTSAAALNAITYVNADYVSAAGRTFTGSTPFAALTGVPAGGDPLIADTLEHLRQYMQLAVARKDERQITQVLESFGALVLEYLRIEYMFPDDSQHYATLAAAYLANAAKTTPSLRSPDVVMDAVHQLAQARKTLITRGVQHQAGTLSNDLQTIAASCVPFSDMRLVLTSVMQEYARALELLLRSPFEIQYDASQLQSSVVAVLTMLLATPEKSLWGEHSTCATPFYSTSHISSLVSTLTQLTNAIVAAEPDNEAAQQVVKRICEWADKLWEPHSTLIQRAAARGSQLTLDLICWITSVGELLLVLATARVTTPQRATDLRRSALWLVSATAALPIDKDTVALTEQFNYTEQMLGTALVAQRHGAQKVADDIATMLLERACTIGAERAAMLSFCKAVRAACVLAAASMEPGTVEQIVTTLRRCLRGTDRPSAEHCAEVAERIYEPRQDWSTIDTAMGHVDQRALREALDACAATLREPRSVQGGSTVGESSRPPD